MRSTTSPISGTDRTPYGEFGAHVRTDLNYLARTRGLVGKDGDGPTAAWSLDDRPRARRDVQGGLFDRPDRALDSLNAKYGRGTAILAAAGRQPGWKLRTEFISRHYTTSWGDLLSV